jgi:N-acetylglucosamine malate deacetylase 2
MTTEEVTPATTAPAALGQFPYVTEVLAVCAHPDDESFGLGALLATLADRGSAVNTLCFTHGEGSTLHGVGGDLGVVRASELAAAAKVLGVEGVELLDYPDGGLDSVALDELVEHVRRAVRVAGSRNLLVFDEGGVTGHRDHCRATEAALAAAAKDNLAVIAWAIPATVADVLNAEFATSFVGRAPHKIDRIIAVDRCRQLEAIACHASQSTENPVLWRRLQLLGDTEHLVLLRTGSRR